ncbi:CdiA C-terminal domain-containing protein [Kribbella sp. NPDC055071]
MARGLVDCLDEVPEVVAHLHRTAARCRENAQVALMASHGQAKVAALQLDAAARACEAAAQYLLMAPPKARAWADRLVGSGGPATNRPSADSADRNKTTGGTGDAAERDAQGRTKRLTATFEDLEVAEDNEPPLITVARKAFEAFRKVRENDDEDNLPEDPLEVQITVLESGELEFDEPSKDEEDKRNTHLLQDFDIAVDLTEPVKTLLAAMAESANHQWQHATLTITTTHLEATFDYPNQPPPAPTIDINLPDRPTIDFDPAFDPRPLGADFAPVVIDPLTSFKPKERFLAERLTKEGWRIDARPEDHTQHKKKNPDVMVRKSGEDVGIVVEFKTPESGSSNAVKRNMERASSQADEVVIDGRQVGLTEEVAGRSFRRACGQPGKVVARVVHVILGDGRLVTFTKEQ